MNYGSKVNEGDSKGRSAASSAIKSQIVGDAENATSAQLNEDEYLIRENDSDLRNSLNSAAMQDTFNKRIAFASSGLLSKSPPRTGGNKVLNFNSSAGLHHHH